MNVSGVPLSDVVVPGSTTARNQHEIELPAIDCEKSIMAKLLYDDKLQEGTEAYLQCALLYTTTSGSMPYDFSPLFGLF